MAGKKSITTLFKDLEKYAKQKEEVLKKASDPNFKGSKSVVDMALRDLKRKMDKTYDEIQEASQRSKAKREKKKK